MDGDNEQQKQAQAAIEYNKGMSLNLDADDKESKDGDEVSIDVSYNGRNIGKIEGMYKRFDYRQTKFNNAMGAVFISLRFKQNENSSFSHFEWLQTASSNGDYERCASPFVDPCSDPPREKRENHPFYHDKADNKLGENVPNATSDANFYDRPGRTPNQNRTIFFNAQTTLVGRMKFGRFQPLITLSWGFTVNYGEGGDPDTKKTPLNVIPLPQIHQNLIRQANKARGYYFFDN